MVFRTTLTVVLVSEALLYAAFLGNKLNKQNKLDHTILFMNFVKFSKNLKLVPSSTYQDCFISSSE